MTDQATRIVPAGWYEDPASPVHVRWWNGLAWTEHTTLKPAQPTYVQQTATYVQQETPQQDAVQQAVPQQADQAATPIPEGYVQTSTGSVITAETAARIAEARDLERQYGISTAEHDIIIQAATAGLQGESPSAAENPRYREYTATGLSDPVVRSTTASAWFIALWPVLTVVAAIAAGYVAFYISPDPAVSGIPVVFALVLLPYLLTLLWAAADARKLRSLGLKPASPALALLGPLIYLIARRVRVPGSGPLVGLLLLTLAIGGGVGAAVATGTSVGVTKALEIQQTVRADLVGSGQLTSVSCPIFIDSVTIGSTYDCSGITADGAEKTVRVSIDSRAGDFSYAILLR